MAKCPDCGKEFDYLEYHETKTYSSEVRLVDGKLEHSDEDTQVDAAGFCCPICNEDVCTGDERAVELLRGE